MCAIGLRTAETRLDCEGRRSRDRSSAPERLGNVWDNGGRVANANAAEEFTGDRRHDEPASRDREEPGRRPSARDDWICGPARHGAGGRSADRSSGTRPGTVELRIPRVRWGSYFTGFSEPGRVAEKALLAVVQEADVHGVSTRSVDDLVQAMGMSGISKSLVSRPCAEIDEKVKAFLARPIEGDWRYLWVDATYVKACQNGRLVSVALIVAVGVNIDGRREMLGVDNCPSEAETFWTAFLRNLARRGLRGV